MIYEAHKAGVDCVKFQKSCLEQKFTQTALKRSYVSKNSWGATYGEHKVHLEFTIEQFKELKTFAEELGLIFSASAMDMVIQNDYFVTFSNLSFLRFPLIS